MFSFLLDEDVLVIGGCPNAIDLTISLLNAAKNLTISMITPSNKTVNALNKSLPKVMLKPIVKRLTVDGAEFIDGTSQNFTSIIIATNYKYSYPFLSFDTGVHYHDYFVQPLYKHIFNIEHPTMVFIGATCSVNTYHLLDLQVYTQMKLRSQNATFINVNIYENII